MHSDADEEACEEEVAGDKQRAKEMDSAGDERGDHIVDIDMDSLDDDDDDDDASVTSEDGGSRSDSGGGQLQSRGCRVHSGGSSYRNTPSAQRTPSARCTHREIHADSTLPVLPVKSRVWYVSGGGRRQEATILRVHYDDLPPYYTVMVDGCERSTVRSKLTPMNKKSGSGVGNGGMGNGGMGNGGMGNGGKGNGLASRATSAQVPVQTKGSRAGKSTLKSGSCSCMAIAGLD